MIELKDLNYTKEDNKEQLPLGFKEEKEKLLKNRMVLKTLDIFVLTLTIIFALFKVIIAFKIFLTLAIIILCLIIIYEMIIRKKLKEKKEKLLKLEEEEIKILKKNRMEEIQKRKEEERKKKKKEILERQSFSNKNDKNKNTKLNKGRNKEKIKEVLEDMCVLGTIMKEEIIEEKRREPEKFISIEEATKVDNKEKGIFCLGLLAQSLENIGITTAIEKNPSKDIETQNMENTVL